MEETLQKLLVFPPFPPPTTPLSDAQYDEGIRAQISAMNKMGEKNLVAKTSGGESALDVIDPAIHSVAYVYILLAHSSLLQKGNKLGMDWNNVWEKIANFLCTFDGRQMRYLGKQLDSVIEVLVHVARNSSMAHRAIAPIGQAILQLDPAGSTFTLRHALLIELALDTEDCSSAVPVLDHVILYFPTQNNQVRYKFLCELNLPASTYINLAHKIKYIDVLEYFYYGAMVYIGCRRWEDAAEFLESAISYPTREFAVSKIMVEAYKKWVLVSVLAHGKPGSIPKSINNTATRSFHTIAKPYESLAEIFLSGTASRLKSEAEFGHQAWKDDRNYGLVVHLLAAYQKNQIRNLANVYSQISIPEVHNMTTSAEVGGKLPNQAAVATLVKDMIDAGELQATLSQPTTGPAILAFSITGPVLSETEMQRELHSSAERIYFLNTEIKNTDKILTHDKEYIKWVQKQKKNAKTGDQGIAGSDMEWNGGDDEELMSGVY